MKYALLTRDILGAAFAVLKELRPGLDERLYEKALTIELVHLGHTVERQRAFGVTYRDQPIGTLIPDLIVDGRIIVEAKVTSGFSDSQLSQLLGYLAITGLEVGLLLSFKEARLQWQRVVRTAHHRSADSCLHIGPGSGTPSSLDRG